MLESISMMKFIIAFIMPCLSLFAVGDFEGVLVYSVTSRMGPNISEENVKYFVKNGLVRQEGRENNSNIHVVQFDPISLKKTTAWKDKWAISEIDLKDYDNSSKLFSDLKESDTSVTSSKDLFSLSSRDDRYSFNIFFKKPRTKSRFLEFFELVRFATKNHEIDDLYIPDNFSYKIGNLKVELKLLMMENREFDSEVFSLPAMPEQSDGSGIFVPKED